MELTTFARLLLFVQTASDLQTGRQALSFVAQLVVKRSTWVAGPLL